MEGIMTGRLSPFSHLLQLGHFVLEVRLERSEIRVQLSHFAFQLQVAAFSQAWQETHIS